LLLVPTIYNVSQTTIDYDFEKFFPKNDPVLDQYLAYRDEFGSDNDFLIVAFESRNKIVSDSSFYYNLLDVEQKLNSLKYINEVVGPTTAKIPIIASGGQFTKKLLKPKMALKNITADPLLVPNIISKDGKNALLLVNHNKGLSKKKSDALLQEIEQIVAPYRTKYTIRLAGKVHGQEHYIGQMSKELGIFSSISLLLLTVILLLFFRALWAVLIPLLVIIYSILLLTAGIYISGDTLSVLTIILPTIIFVVGISDIVHLLNHYLDELRAGKNKEEAVQQGVKIIGKATFLTSVTTAIGFLTLLVSGIEPIRQFGLYSAIGVGIAYILSFSLFPALLLVFKTPPIAKNNKNKERWNSILNKSFDSIFQRKKLIYSLSALMVIAGIFGFSQLKINNYLLEDWSENDPQKLNYKYIDKVFGGVRPFDLILESDSGILNPKVILEIEKLELFVQKEYAIPNTISPATIYKIYNRATHFGLPNEYKLANTNTLNRQYKKISKFSGTKQLQSLVSEDGKRGKLFGRVNDFGGYIFNQKAEKLSEFLQSNINPNLLKVSQTGMPYIIDKNNKDLSSQMILGLLIALAAVSLIMMALFKNMKMLLISIVPNVLPLLGVALFMYLAGIDIKVSTAIIFTIAFGIAVDDTIHYLSRLKIELDSGASLQEAIKASYKSSGKAIIITSIILCSGFFALVFSSFASTFYLGLLVSIVLILAVIIDLTLLPLMCDFFLRKKK
jgi:predicted RND superfamily exporter protein